MRYLICTLLGVFFLTGCVRYAPPSQRIVPAEEFSRAMHSGNASEFSIFKVKEEQKHERPNIHTPQYALNTSARNSQPNPPANYYTGDPRYLQKGYNLAGTLVAAPQDASSQQQVVYAPPASLPLASSAPYHNGQMTANPSLWPDEGHGTSLFRDFRAFQSMDVITILISESQEGKKLAETDTEGKFSLTAGIREFFGLETKEWTTNNSSLDPAELISASTDTKFEGEGETKRSGTLTGTVSAVIMEVLPNGLLRVEGSKIISVNAEEEILVVSGLVRQRDISSENQIQSNRIANMRVDFYGRGIITEQQQPGWGARIFEFVWPF